jgi:hypothetical protein
MTNIPNNNLRIVRIMDAIMCTRCSSAYIADVITTEGERKKMFYCARKDCDNWNSGEDQTGTDSLDKAA